MWQVSLSLSLWWWFKMRPSGSMLPPSSPLNKRVHCSPILVTGTGLRSKVYLECMGPLALVGSKAEMRKVFSPSNVPCSEVGKWERIETKFTVTGYNIKNSEISTNYVIYALVPARGRENKILYKDDLWLWISTLTANFFLARYWNYYLLILEPSTNNHINYKNRRKNRGSNRICQSLRLNVFRYHGLTWQMQIADVLSQCSLSWTYSF
jgi:hypothetical protein